MKVILLKDVRGVGMHGTVHEVSDGYAINALFPRKLAEPATEEKIQQVKAAEAAREANKQKEEEQLDNKVASLRGKQVTLSIRATEKGGLFKAVHEVDIAKAIRAQYSLEVPEAAIKFGSDIKTVGEHKVVLQSKHQKAELGVVVAAA